VPVHTPASGTPSVEIFVKPSGRRRHAAKTESMIILAPKASSDRISTKYLAGLKNLGMPDVEIEKYEQLDR
jgi:hypothetical protein